MSLAAGYQQLPLQGGMIEVSVIKPTLPSDTAIVLLHEGLGSISMWRDFPERLCEQTGYEIVVYSRFGYGASSPCALPRPVDYMEREATGPLPQLIDHIEADRLLLFGHSDGASIAAIYAGTNTDTRLSAILLIAPHFFTEPMALTAIEQAAVAYEEGDLRLRLEKHHGDNVDIAFRGWNDAWLDPDFRGWDIRPYLSKISVPTLLIQGSHDQYGSEAQLRAAEKDISAPVETRLIHGVRHAPHLEQPEAVLDLVTQFCKTHVL